MASFARYLVELRRPRLGFHDVGLLAERAQAACRTAAPPGGPVRFVRAISVPEDGACLLLFEAVDAADVEAVVRSAVIEFDRVTLVLTLDEHEESGTAVAEPKAP